MRVTRILLALTLLLIGACGGGGEPAAEPGGGDTDNGSGQTVAPETPEETEAAEDPAVSGEEFTDQYGFIEYEIGGPAEADGRLSFVPQLSFFSDGVWLMQFSDGAQLLVLQLDPSTPSASFNNGPMSVFADSSTCAFDFDQDGSGAEGSFQCTGASGALPSGAIVDTYDFSGSFEAHP